MSIMSKLQEIFPSVYRINNHFATKSYAPQTRVYDEKLVHINDVEYRHWDIFKSKLAGALAKGLKNMPITQNSLVLYLGASTGTTVSHVSDIVGAEGAVFAVEFAQRSMRDLIKVCERRDNILPIMADANQPQEYQEHLQGEEVDVVYQDVAQPNQAEIFIKNADKFLKKGGEGMLCIKSQSIDVTKAPTVVYKETIQKLQDAGFTTLQTLTLDPYDKDHMFWHGKKQ